jgi:hypothetical protein
MQRTGATCVAPAKAEPWLGILSWRAKAVALTLPLPFLVLVSRTYVRNVSCLALSASVLALCDATEQLTPSSGTVASLCGPVPTVPRAVSSASSPRHPNTAPSVTVHTAAANWLPRWLR